MPQAGRSRHATFATCSARIKGRKVAAPLFGRHSVRQQRRQSPLGPFLDCVPPAVCRFTRAACSIIWPCWFLRFVLLVWAHHGKQQGEGPAHPVARQLLALAATLTQKWMRQPKPARAPTPKELLPKDRRSLWRLGHLACQLQQTSALGTESNAHTAESVPPADKRDHQQLQHQQQLHQQLQQEAASLMRVPPSDGAVTLELLEQMRVALEIWEKEETLQARFKRLFSLGTLLYCVGFSGVLSVTVPLAVLVVPRVLWRTYAVVSRLFESTGLKRAFKVIRDQLMMGLACVHTLLLMPCYPGAGLLISSSFLEAANRQRRQGKGVLLALSSVATAVFNLATTLKARAKLRKWLREWTLMQPLLRRIPPEHADLLKLAHARGWMLVIGESANGVGMLSESRLWSALSTQKEELSYLELPVRHISQQAEEECCEPGAFWQTLWSALLAQMLCAPLAVAHRSQLLGFGAAGGLFVASLMGCLAVNEQSDGLPLGRGPVPALTASGVLLLIRTGAHAMGVSNMLAPFTVGLNVFGSVAPLSVGFLCSTGVLNHLRGRGESLSAETHDFLARGYYVLLALVLWVGAMDPSGSLFNVGCIFGALSICNALIQVSGDGYQKRMIISLLLCGGGYLIHSHPEVFARALLSA